MVQTFVNPDEMQFSLRNSFADQANLPSVSVGANTCIMEFLIREYVQDVAFCKKLSTNDPSYLVFGDNALANYWEIYNVYNAGNVDLTLRAVGSGVFSTAMRINDTYKDVIHVVCVVRELDYAVLINGHLTRTGAKAAHNITSARVRFFGDQITGGVATPGKGAMLRIYSIPAGSTPINESLLATHRRRLLTPMITPPEWAAWEIFRWRGRAANGVDQELDSSTNLHDEIQGSALALSAGTWGNAKAPIWVPR